MFPSESVDDVSPLAFGLDVAHPYVSPQFCITNTHGFRVFVVSFFLTAVATASLAAVLVAAFWRHGLVLGAALCGVDACSAVGAIGCVVSAR